MEICPVRCADKGSKQELTVSTEYSHSKCTRDLCSLFCLLDLSAAVDVYSDWVDACDAVAKDTANKYDGDDDIRAVHSQEHSFPTTNHDVGNSDI